MQYFKVHHLYLPSGLSRFCSKLTCILLSYFPSQVLFKKKLMLIKNNGLFSSSGCTARRDVVACLRELTTKQVLDALPWEQWRNVHFQQLPQPQETSISLIVVDGQYTPENTRH